MLIQKLIQLQTIEKLTDAEFARAKLGIHEKSWNRIKNGKAKGGEKFYRGVLRTYPGLTKEVTEYMSGGDDDTSRKNQ